jgi:hypothetical protein
MVILRFLGSWLLVGAALAMIHDLTQSYFAGSGLRFSSGLSLWTAAEPASLEMLSTWIAARTHRIVWDPLLTTALALPAFLMLGGAGILLLYLGRRRRGVQVYAN